MHSGPPRAGARAPPDRAAADRIVRTSAAAPGMASKISASTFRHCPPRSQALMSVRYVRSSRRAPLPRASCGTHARRTPTCAPAAPASPVGHSLAPPPPSRLRVSPCRVWDRRRWRRGGRLPPQGAVLAAPAGAGLDTAEPATADPQRFAKIRKDSQRFARSRNPRGCRQQHGLYPNHQGLEKRARPTVLHAPAGALADGKQRVVGGSVERRRPAFCGGLGGGGEEGEGT
eukprot:817040-Prorocentrum_minimum.AAC.3